MSPRYGDTVRPGRLARFSLRRLSARWASPRVCFAGTCTAEAEMTARHPKRLSGYFYLSECDPGRCCNVAQILAASPLHTPLPPPPPPYADVYWWNWGGTVVWCGEISAALWGTWCSERTLCWFQLGGGRMNPTGPRWTGSFRAVHLHRWGKFTRRTSCFSVSGLMCCHRISSSSNSSKVSFYLLNKCLIPNERLQQLSEMSHV